jgi:glycosyltransferase involved in cell wall biosynthesis
MTDQAAKTPPLGSAAATPPVGRQVPSVLILTKDEEDNIGPCLECFGFTDDVVVLDSFSDDRTLEVARRFPNVRVVQRAFDTEYKQRNYGFEEVRYKHPWVYVCDADERVPEDLREELIRVVNDPAPGHGAYRLRYRNYFMGKWIKRSSGYPVWLIRLVRPELVRYEVRATNVHPIVQGTVGSLEKHFNHYSFNTGLKRWFEKHNFYSQREALEAVATRRQGIGGTGHLFSRDPMIRRRAIKNLSFFLKMRALWRFLYHVVLRLAFLDGSAGLHYCAMISMYEYWIELKVLEQEKQWRDRTEAVVERRLVEPGGAAPLAPPAPSPAAPPAETVAAPAAGGAS